MKGQQIFKTLGIRPQMIGLTFDFSFLFVIGVLLPAFGFLLALHFSATADGGLESSA